MRKFSTVFKEKQNESIRLHENKVLGDFRNVYSKLLENYGTVSFDSLTEKSKKAFLGELNECWTETEGLSEKGVKFLNDNCAMLTESSTPAQKKDYLKKKAKVLISESFRQYDLKYKIYDILDEMYTQIKGENISDVLSANAIGNMLIASFNESTTELIKTIVHEISDSAKNS